MRIHFRWAAIGLLTWSCILIGSATAQNSAVSIVRTSMFYGDNAIVTADDELRFVLHFSNRTGEQADVCNAYRVWSPDGAVWDSVILTGLGPECPRPGFDRYNDFCWFMPYFDVIDACIISADRGSPADTVGFLGAGRPGTGRLPAGFNDSAYAIVVYLDPEVVNFGRTICIDSSFYPPGVEWVWTGESFEAFYPDWLGLPPAHGGLTPGTCFALLDPSAPRDYDSDGVLDEADNCMYAANVNQADTDGDGLGNICDPWPMDAANDADQDNISGHIDNCPAVANVDQADGDADGVGNACDNCPGLANSDQLNLDGDAQGDLCDAWPLDALNDVDGDGISGHIDNCPAVANAGQEDTNGDGIGNACCCAGMRGNIDGIGGINLLDLMFLIKYLTPPPGPVLPCTEEANVSGTGSINSLDLAFLIDYLTPPNDSELPACP